MSSTTPNAQRHPLVPKGAEITAYPWWMIIDPKQMMKPSAKALARMITGPFFSRESATRVMKCGAFSDRAGVYCHTGTNSAHWRAVCGHPHDMVEAPAIIPAEGQVHPWWVVINPEQMMSPSIGHAAWMVTGIWFSRQRAEQFLRAAHYRYNRRASVHCMSGSQSPEWRSLFEQGASHE